MATKTYNKLKTLLYVYMAVALNRGMSRCPATRLCCIRMSRPVASHVCRGVCREFRAALKKRYETHAVPRRGLSQRLVAEAVAEVCRGLLVASRTALLQTLCRGKTPGSQLHTWTFEPHPYRYVCIRLLSPYQNPTLVTCIPTPLGSKL